MEARQEPYPNINTLSQVHTALLYFSTQNTKCAIAIANNLQRSLVFMKRMMAIGLKYAHKDADGEPMYYLLSWDDNGEALYLPYDENNPQNLPRAVKVDECDEYHKEMEALNKDIDFSTFTVMDVMELTCAPVTAAYLIPLIAARLISNIDTDVIDKLLRGSKAQRNGELVN